MPSPEAIEKGTRAFGVAALISALLMIAIVTGIGLFGWSAVSGSFPPWQARGECAEVAGRVTAAVSSTFGSSTAGATINILVESSSEETVSLPASRDVLARGASGRQYAQSQGLADQSWFFGVEVQPRSSTEVQLGLASASGGTDTVTVVIPNVRTALLSRCDVTLPSVEVSFAG
jgi:hypothetical protein